MGMTDDPEVAPLDGETRFVLKNFGHLLPQWLLEANRLYLLKSKMSTGGYEHLAGEVERFQARVRASQSRGEIVQGSLPEILAEAARRVVLGNPQVVVIARCAKCSNVLATPRARQCLHCGHDWH